MKVRIKELGIPMEVKTTGIEFEIRSPEGTHQGDLILTKTQLIWCSGRTTRVNGKKITLPALIKHMETLK